MYKTKYIKYIKKNMLGGELKVCEEDYINDFTAIQKDGFQNCGIHTKGQELVKCENMIEGKNINQENFIAITNKLMEIKNTNEKGLLPIIYSYCIKEINGIVNYYTKMQKLDGDITDLLFKELPNFIINTKYMEYKQEFNTMIDKILNSVSQTPYEQQSETFDNYEIESTPAKGLILYDSDDDFMQISKPLFGGSKIIIEFDNFIQDYKKHYDINLELINKKAINIIKTLYDNYLVDSDGFIPQNYGYKIVDEKIEDNFEYGYSIEGELNFNVLLYKIDFMSLEIIDTKEKKNFNNFKFNFLDDNRHNFLTKYDNMTESQKSVLSQ
jgi:hypothetical protein